MPFYSYKLQYSILIQFALITFCLPVTMVELRIAPPVLPLYWFILEQQFGVESQFYFVCTSFPIATCVPLCNSVVLLRCSVVLLRFLFLCNPARSELDVRGLRTKAHSNSRWRRLCYCCCSLLSVELYGNHTKNTLNMLKNSWNYPFRRSRKKKKTNSFEVESCRSLSPPNKSVSISVHLE